MLQNELLKEKRIQGKNYFTITEKGSEFIGSYRRLKEFNCGNVEKTE
jgi:predicted transcriptional regulator